MRRTKCILIIALAIVPVLQADPPFSGTIFIDPDIIVPSDATAYQRLEDAGHGQRRMFDRRVNDWITVDAWLFNAFFDDDLSIEVEVNPEFGSVDSSRTEALKYLHAIGQLPTALRSQVRTVWLHKGLQPFGGGNNNLLIHSEQAADYIASGILEEALAHEASHTSLDPVDAASVGWKLAQQNDPEFISTYARDNPTREDVAESLVPYLAVRWRPDRISASLFQSITSAVPNRIRYFDSRNLNMHPLEANRFRLKETTYDSMAGELTLHWVSWPGTTYLVEVSTDLVHWSPVGGTVTATSAEASYEVSRSDFPNGAFFMIRLNR